MTQAEMVDTFRKLCIEPLFTDNDSKQTAIAIHMIVTYVEDNATMSSIRYFENHVSYFVQNRRK